MSTLAHNGFIYDWNAESRTLSFYNLLRWMQISMMKEKTKTKRPSTYTQIGQKISHLSKISNCGWLFIWILWWKHYVRDEYKDIISELEVMKGQETKAVFIIYEQQSRSTFPMLLSLLLCLVLQTRSTGNWFPGNRWKTQGSTETETTAGLR